MPTRRVLAFAALIAAAMPALADPDAEVDRAQALYNSGDRAQAQTICDAVVAGGATGTPLARAHHCRAILARDGEDFARCVEEAKAAIAIEDKAPYNLTGARCAMRAQQIDAADALAARAIALDPEMGDAYQVRCGALPALQRAGEAVPLCERGAALQPRSAAIRALLGLAAEAAGDPVKAKGAYQAALAIDADNQVATDGLARLGQ